MEAAGISVITPVDMITEDCVGAIMSDADDPDMVIIVRAVAVWDTTSDIDSASDVLTEDESTCDDDNSDIDDM